MAMRNAILMLGLTGIMASGVGAAVPAPVQTRQAGFKALGAAFKQVSDIARSGASNPVQLQKAVMQIRVAARNQYGWFPTGSGPSAGIKTAAKPEIWAQVARFREAQDAFARQSAALATAARGGDLTIIGAEARKLGAACKGCHDQFRQSDD